MSTRQQTEQLQTFDRTKRKPATRRERWAWYFFDFGNSAYAAVIILAVYSVYFKQQVVGGAEGARLWGLSVGIVMLVVALISPVLGALADFSGVKKKLLAVFSSMAIVFTAMLFFVEQGDIWMGMLFFILAEIGYRGGQVFHNAFLPDVAEPEEMGRVSGNGWAFGSLGGIICLLVVLALIMLVEGALMVRISFLITALFFLLSAAPLFLFLRERTIPQRLPAHENYVSVSIKRLYQTWKSAGNHRQFLLFIIAFLIMNNSIMMVMNFAGIIGAVMFNMNQQQLIVFMIIVQITSVLGAYIFGKIVDRLSSKWALALSLVGMIVACSLLFIAESLPAFNLIGALAGFALTGVQSVTRTAVGQLAPEEKTTEFFGIYSLSGQISGFTGPTIYGLLATSIALMYKRAGWDVLHAEQAGMRLAVIAMIVFLLLGLLVLLSIKNWNTARKLHSEIKDPHMNGSIGPGLLS